MFARCVFKANGGGLLITLDHNTISSIVILVTLDYTRAWMDLKNSGN